MEVGDGRAVGGQRDLLHAENQCKDESLHTSYLVKISLLNESLMHVHDLNAGLRMHSSQCPYVHTGE